MLHNRVVTPETLQINHWDNMARVCLGPNWYTAIIILQVVSGNVSFHGNLQPFIKYNVDIWKSRQTEKRWGCMKWGTNFSKIVVWNVIEYRQNHHQYALPCLWNPGIFSREILNDMVIKILSNFGHTTRPSTTLSYSLSNNFAYYIFKRGLYW